MKNSFKSLFLGYSYIIFQLFAIWEMSSLFQLNSRLNWKSSSTNKNKGGKVLFKKLVLKGEQIIHLILLNEAIIFFFHRGCNAEYRKHTCVRGLSLRGEDGVIKGTQLCVGVITGGWIIRPKTTGHGSVSGAVSCQG